METGLIYLDHMASTPLDGRVRDVMLPWLATRAAGNPHSAHRAGWVAAEAVERARAEVAALIGARPGEIVFTSGATEANNLALFGASRPGGTVVVSAVEHPSVLACLPKLEDCARTTRIAPVDRHGRLDLDAFGAALDDLEPGDAVASVMAANHEVGTIQPLAGVVALAKSHGALVHADATQALSTKPVDVGKLKVDLLSFSAHKLYGPQGIGALWIRDGLALEPILFGGGQEHGLRPGTLPVALIVGFGEACRIAREEREIDAERLGRLRDRLRQGIRACWPEAIWNGRDDGLPHCLSVTLPGVDAADLLLDLPCLCLSTGSACATGHAGPSPVLLAMGRSPEAAHGTLRFGLGRFTSPDEIACALDHLAGALRTRRSALVHPA